MAIHMLVYICLTLITNTFDDMKAREYAFNYASFRMVSELLDKLPVASLDTIELNLTDLIRNTSNYTQWVIDNVSGE